MYQKLDDLSLKAVRGGINGDVTVGPAVVSQLGAGPTVFTLPNGNVLLIENMSVKGQLQIADAFVA